MTKVNELTLLILEKTAKLMAERKAGTPQGDKWDAEVVKHQTRHMHPMASILHHYD